jgi:hypothetical protein
VIQVVAMVLFKKKVVEMVAMVALILQKLVVVDE